ncbi:AraC family transcriptional regulator (plasmid) [Rhizobium sp. 32-5/1]|uniref:helix-turn-helix domain-containing protein n=1 Tax=Rhizobium sp. 32-5/1 TaxID=3019602 RepID=UPI00240E3767|nr:AraC family transcriptional regulator [Rhizobium sp. 32-5/1]WEZ85973.1 AraC family transcriptional regulator [Rhizobium sp. 32-5/1]
MWLTTLYFSKRESVRSDLAISPDFVSHFKTASVSSLLAAGPKKSRLFVSRVRRDTPGYGLAPPQGHQFGAVFAVLLQLKEQTNRELFIDGKCVHRGSYAARTTSIVNFLEKPVANLLSPFDNLIFIVPQAALDEIAEETGVRRIDQLRCERGGVFDETVWHLGNALLPALERPHEIGPRYADQMMLAINTYFAQTFGDMRAGKSTTGRLADWQLRRAKEAMTSIAEEDLSLAELARHCGLSVSYFVRAFKMTTGDPPHRWMLRERVERSKGFLAHADASLAEIAVGCGFADQSHFTRMFKSFVGVTPAAWRRAMKS